MQQQDHRRRRERPRLGLLVLATAVLALPACDSYFPEEPIIVRDEMVGLRASYLPYEDARSLELVVDTSFEATGATVALADFTLAPATGLGITIRTGGGAPGGPSSVLKIPGFSRITEVVGNYFTYESYTDRVSIRIDGLDRYTFGRRERDRLPAPDPYALLRDRRAADAFPDLERHYDGSFALECVDSSAGYVVAWEMTTLRKPQCRFR